MLGMTRQQTVSVRFRDFTALRRVLRQKQVLMEEFDRLGRSCALQEAIECEEIGPQDRAELERLVAEILSVFRELLQLEAGSQQGALKELMESKRRGKGIQLAGIGARARRAYAAADALRGPLTPGNAT